MSELEEIVRSAQEVQDVLVPDLMDDAQTRISDVTQRLDRAIEHLLRAKEYALGSTTDAQLRLVV